MIKQPLLDEEKLPVVMALIEEASSLLAEKEEEKTKQTLASLEQELRSLTGNPDIEINSFQDYWEVTDLTTMAKGVLYGVVPKETVSDEQIKEIVLHILDYDEAEMEYWIRYLKVNTGLKNLSDYIFYPTFDTIIADRKSS